jgi:D-amino peptidase
MEGLSGLNDIKAIDFGNPEYTPGRELLTNDVNAVIDGLCAGGADVIDIFDFHGSGNPEPDIILDRLDKRAQMLYLDKPPYHPVIGLGKRGEYDGIAFVGMHTGLGGGGFLAHTASTGLDFTLNGISISETDLLAIWWGDFDAPCIFVSGDDKLKENLEWMTWIEYVVAKYATSVSTANLRPFDEVHAEMRAASKRAVENIPKAKVVKLTTPIKGQLRAVHPNSLRPLEGIPGLDCKDNTVTLERDNLNELILSFSKFMSLAYTFGRLQLLEQILAKHEYGTQIFDEVRKERNDLWIEVESGRWKPPVISSSIPKGKKYFGAQ